MAAHSDPPKLTPPPRPPEIRPNGGRRVPDSPHEPGPRTPRFATFATTALFAVLGLVTVFVFFVLPGRVERRPPEPNPQAEMAVPEPSALPTRPAVPSAPAVATPRPRPVDSPVATGNHQAPRRESDSAPLTPPLPPPKAPPDRDREFAAAMSRGLAALEAGDPASARKAFEEAASLIPESAEAADGLLRSERMERRRRIAELRVRAEAAASREDWAAAEDAYSEVLDIDGNIAFARNGHAAAADRRELFETVEFHLTHPDRLVSDDVLSEAEATLDRARQLHPRGPRLEQLTSRLADLVEVASTPVAVSFHSDNATEVVIYRVGSIGVFSRTTVQLRPGSYTVVGRRNGYRDVRIEVTVRPEGPMPPVVIRCEEEV